MKKTFIALLLLTACKAPGTQSKNDTDFKLTEKQMRMEMGVDTTDSAKHVTERENKPYNPVK